MASPTPIAYPMAPELLPAPSARVLLVSILGELAYPYDEPVWTSALLHVLRGVGVEGQAARQAISRGSAAGWIESERVGRARRWRLAGKGREIVEDGMRRRDAFLAEPAGWDGRWLTVFVSVPNDRRAVRKRLYGALTWMGFGNPTPGVWLTPHAHEVDRVRALVRELDLEASTICIVGTVGDAGLYEGQIVRDAWDLEDLAARYRAMVAHFGRLEPAPGDETLFAHVALLGALQYVLRHDPELPVALQPNWVGREGAALFRRRREEWTAPAHERWRELVAAGP